MSENEGPEPRLSQAERDQLVLDHQGLVKSIARKFRSTLPPDVEIGDLEGYGQLGIVHAAEHFDPDRGIAFSTFAYYRIRGAMIDGLRADSWTPAFRAELASASGDNALREDSLSVLDEADAQAMAARFQAEIKRLFVIRVASQLPTDEGRGAPEPTHTVAPSARLEAEEEAQSRFRMTGKMQSAVERLPERERETVRRHYTGGETFTAIAMDYNVDKATVTRWHKRALDRLREMMEE